MLFDKAIRRRQLKLEVTQTKLPEEQILSGRSELALSPKPQLQDYIKNKSWPEIIIIRAGWDVIENHEKVKAQEVVNGLALAECDIYQPNVTNIPAIAAHANNKGLILKTKTTAKLICDGVELMVTNQDNPEALQLPFDQVLFEKQAKSAPAPRLVQHRQSLEAGNWLVTGPLSQTSNLNLVCLFDYGLYGAPGSSLSEIEQIYASLSSDEAEGTKIKLYKASYLAQLGITKPDGGLYQQWKYEFINKTPDTTLAKDITSESITIQVTIDKEVRTYVSKDFKDVAKDTQLIDLIFIPKP